MAGTATNLDGGQIEIGPGYLWADVAVPAAGARLTLHTDGTPDSTANPNAKNLGLTEGGTVIEFGVETQDFESDELTSPHLSRIIRQPTSMKFTLLQLRNLNEVMKYVATGSTYATGSGYKELAFGGLSLPTTYSFAMIAPDLADPTKFIVVQIYKGYNRAPFSFNLTRKEQSKVPVEIRALSISTRASGDQTGKFWIQI